MEFLKKHYEKIILSVVLLGLAAVSALLPFKIAEIVDKINEEPVVPKPKTAELIAADKHLTTIQKGKEPPPVNFSGSHRVINPVRWVQNQNKEILKFEGKGPGDAKVTAVKALKLYITFKGADTSGARTRYIFDVTQEAHVLPRKRKEEERKLEVGFSNEVFLLKELQGNNPDSPTGAVLRMDDGDTITVKTGETYEKVEGYSVDFTFPGERKKFANKRVTDSVNFYGDKYYIVAISNNQLVLSAESDGVRVKIPIDPESAVE